MSLLRNIPGTRNADFRQHEQGNGGTIPPEILAEDTKAGVSNQTLSGVGTPEVQEVGFGRAAART